MGKKKAEQKQSLFFASKDKYSRAVNLFNAKKYKSVKAAYDALDGSYSEGTGYKEVK